MAKQRKWGTAKTIVCGVVSGAIIAVPGLIYNHYFLASAESIFADGVRILDIQQTSTALDGITETCAQLSSVMRDRPQRPADTMVAELRESFVKLEKSVKAVETTEYYTVAELKSICFGQGWSPTQEQNFLDQHIGKPKRVVTGVRQLESQLTGIAAQLEALDRQVAQEPHVDIDALRDAIASIASAARSANSSLEARQTATLQTLQKLSNTRKPQRPELP